MRLSQGQLPFDTHVVAGAGWYGRDRVCDWRADADQLRGVDAATVSALIKALAKSKWRR